MNHQKKNLNNNNFQYDFVFFFSVCSYHTNIHNEIFISPNCVGGKWKIK